jgi:glycosyltransferase involved in cell wall biosynthesis
VISGDPYDDPPVGVEVEVVPIRREFALSDATSFLRLWQVLRRHRFDFVQTHTPKASFLGIPAARLAGSAAVYTIHGSLYFDGNGLVANVLGWCFERWCCMWAHRVLVQSAEDQRVLPRVHICSHRKLDYVGNGIVVDRFLSPIPPALPSARPVVLMISRLVREKGCDDFLRIAEALSGRADFVHVGPSEHDQSDALPEAVVKAASDAGTVTFIGAVDDVRPYLASASVVVLPSYREGIPRAAMEAAVTGRPVAAYDIRGVREVIDPQSGLLAPRGDWRALTAVVDGLLKDPERCAELGARCRDRVVTRFSEDQVLERLRAVYRSLAEEVA